MGLEQPGAVKGVPAHGKGWNWMGFEVSCNPNHSVTLWDFEKKKSFVTLSYTLSIKEYHCAFTSAAGRDLNHSQAAALQRVPRAGSKIEG